MNYLLDDLLLQFDLTREQFHKQGRVPNELVLKRKQIVTFLHEQGIPWKEMAGILEKPLSFIQRNTDAMWNTKSRKNSSDSGVRTGKTWKGKKRPGQLERQWENGDFDSLVGRTLPTEHVENMKAGWTPEVKENHSLRVIESWKDPLFRENLMAFHRSPQERIRRSQLQTLRMTLDPVKWTRGNGSYIEVSKCIGASQLWVRSTYERKTVQLLEGNTHVTSYEYEKILDWEGRWVKPDFLIHYGDGTSLLVEVKAKWVLDLPKDHKVQQRLQISRGLAHIHGWGFEIWTQKELGL